MKNILADQLSLLEKHLGSDVFVLYGELQYGIDGVVKKIIEDLSSDTDKTKTLYVILTTIGGSLAPVKRIVETLRNFYDEIYFIVPDYAYSAGTVMCASGDKIYMSYFSALGPIDPQEKNKDGKFVSALGYLDKVNDLIKKSKDGTISAVEFAILQDFDLAELRAYEQARDFAIDLLKEWLPKYKFKDWNEHGSDGRPVTMKEKIDRAEEIASSLSNNNEWKIHGRPINRQELRDKLSLVIDDLETDDVLYSLINRYYALMTDYIMGNNLKWFLHTRRYI